MAGPGHGPKPRGMKPPVENPMKVFKRIMKYVFKKYLVQFIYCQQKISQALTCDIFNSNYFAALIASSVPQ